VVLQDLHCTDTLLRILAEASLDNLLELWWVPGPHISLREAVILELELPFLDYPFCLAGHQKVNDRPDTPHVVSPVRLNPLKRRAVPQDGVHEEPVPAVHQRCHVLVL
jgi:hypothetical protein